MEVRAFTENKELRLDGVEVITGWHGESPTTAFGRVRLFENDIEKIEKALSELHEKK